MSQYLNSGMLASGGSMFASLSIHDEDKTDLHNPRFNWTYQQRNQAEVGGGCAKWVELWPTSKMASGDSTVALCMLGQDMSASGHFEYQSSISRGMVRPYFIRGTVKDSVGAAVTGARVQAIVADTNTYAGQVYSDSNGKYELPTIFIGNNHYLVAYNDGNSQAGTSVNTIQPVL
jgi:hypothetical protein